eukprot:m.18742 g.18742  ORF g.18742 m.18742 type:complete len:56 (-) comp8538_c2_seq2:79-246(-)
MKVSSCSLKLHVRSCKEQMFSLIPGIAKIFCQQKRVLIDTHEEVVSVDELAKLQH